MIVDSKGNKLEAKDFVQPNPSCLGPAQIVRCNSTYSVIKYVRTGIEENRITQCLTKIEPEDLI